jgi:hypothetical protein
MKNKDTPFPKHRIVDALGGGNKGLRLTARINSLVPLRSERRLAVQRAAKIEVDKESFARNRSN